MEAIEIAATRSQSLPSQAGADEGRLCNCRRGLNRQIGMKATFLFLTFLFLLFSAPLPVRADAPITHTVAWGETLYSIARVYVIAPQEIARANGMDAESWLYAGQRLTIPLALRDSNSISTLTPSGYYTVRAGDTLYSIASRFGVSVDALSSANDLPPNGFLYVGWSLKVSGASQSADSATAGGVSTYIVQRGDSLAVIGLRFGTTVQALAIANNLSNYWLIYAGQRLKVPRSAPQRVAAISAANETRVSNIPLYRQQQTLTCEEAAAAMATRGAVSEARLVAVLPRSDNPFAGIRGRTNSPYYGGLVDYGIYAHGLQKGLNALGIKSQILYEQTYADFKNALLAHLRAGRAIIWWHTWQESYQTPVRVKTSDGAAVKLVPYEHASVIVGANDRGVIYHDPYDASVRLAIWQDFQRVSAYFDNMALVIQ